MGLDVFAILVWLVSIFCGFLLGQARGQVVSGLVWTLCFGPIGLIVLLCLPNRKKQEEEREQQRIQREQMELQRQQIEELKRLRFGTPSQPAAIPTNQVTIRVARNGTDLGEISVGRVRKLLATGALSTTDYYFDHEAGQWLPLDSCLHL